MYFFFYYPLGVQRRPAGPAWATWSLTGIMLTVFLYFHTHPMAALLNWEWWVYFPQASLRPGLFLSVFNHVGWMHIAGNLIYLWTFGPSLERELGGARYLLLFVFLGVMSNLAQGLVSSTLLTAGAGLGVVGASGAISGLLGLFVLRFPYARIRTAWVLFSPLYGQVKSGVVAIPSLLAVGSWVALQLVHVGAKALGGADGTAYGAHLGGLVTGLLLGWALKLPREGRQFGLRHAAERRLERGDWMGAYEAIQPLLEADDPEDLCLGARCARLLGFGTVGRGLYHRAVRGALAQDDEVGAATVYAEALGGYPDLAFPQPQLYRLALGLDRLGRPRAALRAMEIFRALYGDSERMPLVLLRAARLEEGVDPDRARALYDEQLRRWPQSPYGGLARRALETLENV